MRPVLSTFEPAHIPKGKTLRTVVGQDISIPTGTLSKAVDAAEAVLEVAETGELEESQLIDLFEGATALLLNPPSYNTHLAGAWLPADRVEVRLRHAFGGGVRVSARYQFLEQDVHGLDMAAGLALGFHDQAFPVDDVLPGVESSGFRHRMYEIPVAAGWHASWFRFWFGPKLMFATYDLEFSARTDFLTASALASGSGSYLGGHVGVALGYEAAFVALEITTVRASMTGELSASAANIEVAGVSFDQVGWVIYPGVAFMGLF